MDFAGTFLGSMYLIAVDAYSKWVDVFPMQSITTTKTIEKLRILFATHDFPEKLSRTPLLVPSLQNSCPRTASTMSSSLHAFPQQMDWLNVQYSHSNKESQDLLVVQFKMQTGHLASRCLTESLKLAGKAETGS